MSSDRLEKRPGTQQDRLMGMEQKIYANRSFGNRTEFDELFHANGSHGSEESIVHRIRREQRENAAAY
jgi:hypothetical protein